MLKGRVEDCMKYLCSAAFFNNQIAPVVLTVQAEKQTKCTSS